MDFKIWTRDFSDRKRTENALQQVKDKER